MTVGALLFAFDSEIKYTKLAVECAKRIKQYLDIPVTLVTNIKLDTDIFENQILVTKPDGRNKRYWTDTGEVTSWYNFGRNSAIDLTPYDRTLLIDIDYIVNSDSLLSLLNCTQPFLCHQYVHNADLSKCQIITLGSKNTQMWWATVVVFDKSVFSQDVFDCWKMVEQNYKHYANLFGFDYNNFRNDFALSIALLLANGNTIPDQCDIPWPLLTADADIPVTYKDNTWWIEYKVHERGKLIPKKISLKNQDIHVIGKSYLEKIYEL